MFKNVVFVDGKRQLELDIKCFSFMILSDCWRVLLNNNKW